MSINLIATESYAELDEEKKIVLAFGNVFTINVSLDEYERTMIYLDHRDEVEEEMYNLAWGDDTRKKLLGEYEEEILDLAREDVNRINLALGECEWIMINLARRDVNRVELNMPPRTRRSKAAYLVIGAWLARMYALAALKEAYDAGRILDFNPIVEAQYLLHTYSDAYGDVIYEENYPEKNVEENAEENTEEDFEADFEYEDEAT